MLKKILILLFLIPVLANAEEPNAEASDELVNMMVIAKATGVCGVIAQLIRFQETTKMEGGNEFIVRFLSTESARLGLTLESYTGRCPNITEKYKGYMELLGFNE